MQDMGLGPIHEAICILPSKAVFRLNCCIWKLIMLKPLESGSKGGSKTTVQPGRLAHGRTVHYGD